MQGIKVCFYVFLLGLLFSCKTDYSTKNYGREQYISWIQSQELSWEKDMGDFTTQLHYIPGDYKMLMDYRSDHSILTDSIQTRYKKLEYYRLTINPKDGGGNLMDLGANSQGDYSGRLEFLLSGIQPDFYILEESDTLHCLDSYFERSYGMQKGLTFLLTFPLSDHTQGRRTFVYDERLFNLGKLQFAQDLEQLYNIPTLKL